MGLTETAKTDRARMIPKPVIVFDTATQPFLSNRIFDPVHAARFPGASWLSCLNDRCIERGWQMMTADVFLDNQVAASSVLCISDMVTPYTQRLLARGAIPTVIWCGESPNVAWDFYHHLTRYTAHYKHAFMFRGVQNLVQQPTQFHSFYWPNSQRHALCDLPWGERGFLVLIASNKRRFQVSNRKPFEGVRRLGKQVVWRYLQARNQVFQFEDLYQKRLEAILHFAKVPGFQLLGAGWEQANGLPGKYYQAAQQVWAGSLEYQRKREVMSSFKFTLCFENCIFPGYVTEKIFDCFLAGCIPIYFGAPDIADFVPPQTFIDFRQFGDYADLDRFLRSMTEADACHYLEAAQDFLASSAFDRFTVDYFVSDVLNSIEQEFL